MRLGIKTFIRYDNLTSNGTPKAIKYIYFKTMLKHEKF